MGNSSSERSEGDFLVTPPNGEDSVARRRDQRNPSIADLLPIQEEKIIYPERTLLGATVSDEPIIMTDLFRPSYSQTLFDRFTQESRKNYIPPILHILTH